MRYARQCVCCYRKGEGFAVKALIGRVPTHNRMAATVGENSARAKRLLFELCTLFVVARQVKNKTKKTNKNKMSNAGSKETPSLSRGVPRRICLCERHGCGKARGG